MIRYDSREYWVSLIRMSLSRFFILHALHLRPLHGYEISRQVASFTNGCCAPTEGSLYPLLRDMEESGILSVAVQVVSGRERKVYTLTEKGEQAYQVAAQAWGEAARYVLEAVAEESHV
ncbi:PadR family transcriptional regulator [Syntrophothermus lipocalidus]|uniref:Transcriptional regulator, PadR-like family n=1 Tax=Syntrophothermus lipocalidus (strain DSM 12680 / TGB-C1) TaxID=643648 RepID=D7CJI0_SYNLT|nr:PadR family transcriptional regulator [Syntrophothermus lipocalidus]ADI02935.1 transcriptional regulator, PadR-like family [Syntrophothermus lipocalidus DSM 12680]HOV43444.1 PadR family transcriptional regulator [Syntrophothermus lipocalidus]